MSRSHILVFDHGTTSIRACVLDRAGTIVARAQESFEQIYPHSGWVEHQPETLWELTMQVAQAALKAADLGWLDIAVAGLTNQRETTILWDKQTGKPLYNAIVWQCRRTADYCDALKQAGHADQIADKTGLVVDAYFSASKIRWILDQAPDAKRLIAENRLLFGTVDTYILWHLSGQQLHVTDPTNASRTMLFNIHQQRWDQDLLALFDIPESLLPKVLASNVRLGHIDPALTGGVEVPLAGIAGDQQAALYGQKCWTAGTAKSTYGTGAFLVMNTGQTPVRSHQGLLTTLATDAAGNSAYALEGSIFIAGAALEWLNQKLDVFQAMREVDTLARSVPDNQGVYLVPAFTGLGTPYWDANARGGLFGLTQDTGKAHLVRAALESMAYQTQAVLAAMQTEARCSLEALRIDGGVTRSDFLAQFLADILNVPVERADDPELTAKGVGYLAGLAVGFWKNPDEIRTLPEQTERFVPHMPEATRQQLLLGWQQSVRRILA